MERTGNYRLVRIDSGGVPWEPDEIRLCKYFHLLVSAKSYASEDFSRIKSQFKYKDQLEWAEYDKCMVARLLYKHYQITAFVFEDLEAGE